MAVLVETKNLKKYFKSGAGMVHAVDDITLCAWRRTFLAGASPKSAR